VTGGRRVGAGGIALLLAACGGSDPGGARDSVCAPLATLGPRLDPDGAFCDRLSSYGLFEDVAAQRPVAGVMAYDLATPLFSDYAAKARFLWLPPGAAAEWHASDALALPVGTIVAKTFSYPRDRRGDGAAAGSRLLETRLLVRGTAGWRGVAYVYAEDDPTDAVRAVAGAAIDAAWIHDDGAERTNRYAVPNQNQCKNCHAEHDDTLDVIGLKARHIHRPGPPGSGIASQLQALVDRGQLRGAPPPASWPRAVAAADPAAGTIDQRARHWLDIQCAACHNARGGAARTSGLYLDLAQTELTALGLCKPPIAAGRGSGGRAYGIVPGRPDASILLFRIESTEPAIRMPELGRNLVDAEGAALIRAWIAQLPGGCP
jgi:uncharacterized repeat protein (TIGR03806 family)